MLSRGAAHLNVDAGGQVERHELVHGLGGEILHVNQPLVQAHLKLLARVLVHVGGAQHGVDLPPARRSEGWVQSRQGRTMHSWQHRGWRGGGHDVGSVRL